ncbi:MAG TPA: two-component regulator propeller domain-containing protein, partial [Terriglobales bacterium]|nr:two-component regulator propeller domain-containing protein [Terriglobales bacterium]
MRPSHIPRTVLLAMLYVFLCKAASADTRDRTISQFQHTEWTAREGAPSPIWALAQTTDGYLWLAADSGLFRFDGVQFERYGLKSGAKSGSESVYSLLATSDGGLWIGLHFGGASYLKDGRMTSYGEPEGLPPGTLNTFAVDREGTVWAAANGGLARLEGSGWQRIGQDWGYRGKSAKSVLMDREGTLWVATEDTVVFLPRGQKVFRETGERVSSGEMVNRMAQAPGGRVWLSEYGKRSKPVMVQRRKSRQQVPEIETSGGSILFDHAGSLWIADGDHGLLRVRFPERLKGGKIAHSSPAVETFGKRDGLTDNLTNAVFEDREGNIWFGTGTGLDRFRATNIVPIPFPTAMSVVALAGGIQGSDWAGVWSGLRGEALLHIPGTAPIAHRFEHWVSCAYRGANGDLWLGTQDGLWRFGNGRFVRVPLPEEITKGSDVQALAEDHSGNLWVSIIRNGVFLRAHGVWMRSGSIPNLPYPGVLTMMTDSAGRAWFGYVDGRIALLDGNIVRVFSPQDGLQVGVVKAIHEHGQHIWIGGEQGLALFDGSRFRTLTADGGPALSGISGIMETASGDLWLNAAPGIIHIPAAEIGRAIETRDYRVHGEVFDYLDGLPGKALPLRPLPGVVASSDGKLWFATTGGIVQVDANHLTRNAMPPPVFIRSVDSDAKAYAPSADLHLPSRMTSLHIAYTALNFAVPERVRFRYRLEGFDKYWQEANTRREAFYTNLAPRHYRFRVIACNNDGVWNEQGAATEFSILPAFYQTRWFLLLCFVAAGLLVWMVYQWRLSLAAARLDQKFQERLAERTRIAGDLHDTLLQGFLGAAMRLHVANKHLPSDWPAKPLVAEVLEQMRNVIDEGRN